MREIEFRAWDEEGQKMYHGVDIEEMRLRDLASPECVVFQQYTGLLDKNGVKIFEGDKVESDSGKRQYIVTYREASAKYVLAGIGKAWWIHDMQPAIVSMSVIGNIHEADNG